VPQPQHSTPDAPRKLVPTPWPPPRTEAREELRRQVGTLRFDLNTLATAKTGKEEKKAALALSKEFLTAVRRGAGPRRALRCGAAVMRWREPRRRCVQQSVGWLAAPPFILPAAHARASHF
jgi:hypothetical protein